MSFQVALVEGPDRHTSIRVNPTTYTGRWRAQFRAGFFNAWNHKSGCRLTATPGNPWCDQRGAGPANHSVRI